MQYDCLQSVVRTGRPTEMRFPWLREVLFVQPPAQLPVASHPVSGKSVRLAPHSALRAYNQVILQRPAQEKAGRWDIPDNFERQVKD